MVVMRGLALLMAGCLIATSGVAADNQPSAAQMMDDLMYGRGQIGGPFSLVDQTGKLRNDREFRGKLMIVYFGYTFCPDVCPGDLQSITLALDQLGPLADEVQPVFITIDPERDNDVLAQYVSAFHPTLIGLTGTPDQIDHAGVIYLMGRDGKYLGFIPPQTAPDRLVEVLRSYLAN